MPIVVLIEKLYNFLIIVDPMKSNSATRDDCGWNLFLYA